MAQIRRKMARKTTGTVQTSLRMKVTFWRRVLVAGGRREGRRWVKHDVQYTFSTSHKSCLHIFICTSLFKLVWSNLTVATCAVECFDQNNTLCWLVFGKIELKFFKHDWHFDPDMQNMIKTKHGRYSLLSFGSQYYRNRHNFVVTVLLDAFLTNSQSWSSDTTIYWNQIVWCSVLVEEPRLADSCQKI